MDRSRYAQVKELFAQVRALAPEERESALRRACGSDDGLFEEVQELLAADDPDGAIGQALQSQAKSPEDLGGAGTLRMPQTEKPGDQIGAYLLLDVLGEGGFGAVYRARQEEPVRREVALKVLKLGMDTREVVARFEAERQALARMDHPSIAKVYDAGATERGRPFFVMELVAGEGITTYCRRNALSVEERLQLFRQVCLAVQHAHQKGVLHRDLKPGNVLVAEVDGEPLVKVIDFGIAKAIQEPLTDASLATEAFQVMGTPEYMPPEQAAGEDVDTRADVYALGVLLYELLTGSLPFERRTSGIEGLGTLLREIHDVTPPKPSTRVSQLGGDGAEIARASGNQATGYVRALRGDLDWIVMKALEKDRERRYPTAAALAEDLSNHLEHLPVSAGPPSRRYRLRKLVRRNRPLFVAGATVLATVLVGLGTLTWGFLVVRDERDAADQARAEEAKAREVAVNAQREEARERERAEEAREAAERARQREQDERERAEEARDEAGEVVDFLATALAAVHPENLGRSVTMREVLDQAARNIDGRFDQRPRVEARLRFVIGNSYDALGLPREAEEHLAEAFVLYRDLEGEGAVDTTATALQLAEVYIRQDRLDDVVPLLDDLLAGDSDSLTFPEETAFEAWNAIAVACFQRAEYDRAEEIWEAQIAAAEENPDFELDGVVAMGNLAMVYEDTARPQEALALLRRALDYERVEYGPEHPETLKVWSNVTSALTSLGRYDEAEAELFELIEVRTRVLGDEHPDTASSLFNLALVYQRTGRIEQALELTQLVLELETNLFGEAHRWSLLTRNQLGVLYRDAGRLDEAEATLRETIELARTHLGVEDEETLMPLQSLADVLVDRGRLEEGLALYDEVLDLRAKTSGLRTRLALVSRQNRAGLLSELGRDAEAIEELEAVLAGWRETMGAEHDDLGLVHLRLARAYEGAGRFASAEEQFTTAYERLRAVYGDGAPRALRAAVGLCEMLARQGRAHDERDRIARVKALVVEASTRPGSGSGAGGDGPGVLERLAFARFLLTCEPADLRDPQHALALAEGLLAETSGDGGAAAELADQARSVLAEREQRGPSEAPSSVGSSE